MSSKSTVQLKVEKSWNFDSKEAEIQGDRDTKTTIQSKVSRNEETSIVLEKQINENSEAQTKLEIRHKDILKVHIKRNINRTNPNRPEELSVKLRKVFKTLKREYRSLQCGARDETTPEIK